MLVPQAALADTVSLAAYRDRLAAARASLVTAQRAGPSQRPALVADARALLRRTDAVLLGSGGTLAIDDAGLAEPLDATDAGIAGTIARLDARLLLVSRLGSPAIDGARADAARDAAVRPTVAAAGRSVMDVLQQLVLSFLAGLSGPRLDPRWLVTAVGLLGVAVILFVVATLGRGLPERVRREVLVADRTHGAHADPRAHLRAADAALAAGAPRDALHALFLYVITSLSDREVIRYDPSFTDRELLAATVAIPHAEELRDLVGMYERSWFGLRAPSRDEVARARELALRVAP